MRIGHGYDAHVLVSGSGLILGGVHIESKFSIEAFSDGDLIIHALIDAILGAAGYEDIGSMFPSGDKKYRNISSRELLREVAKKMNEDSYVVKNLDITFIGKIPKLKNHVKKIRENIAKDLGIDFDRVNCKATTTDGLGFEGEGKGLSCHAVVLIKKDQD